MAPSIVLSFSGGLDTSAIVPWLREQYGAEVWCYTADLGQGGLDELERRAAEVGAAGCVVEDQRERFLTEFVFPTLRAGAVYSREYLLGTAMARPLIAAGQVAMARRVGATGLAHGCTGKGNDQVRFELTYQALAPDLDVIAPWRVWNLRGRQELVAYVASRGIPIEAGPEQAISRDQNLWHCSHEGGPLEDPAVAPPPEIFRLTADPAAAPGTPEEVVIDFDEGLPVALDAVPLGAVRLVERLNAMAGAHGVGRADVVEDRMVGMKSRGIYETPAGTVLRIAHRALEQLVLDRRTLALKDALAQSYADLVYEGRWWTTEREALDAFVRITQRRVTGRVRMRLLKGTAAVLGRESPFTLHSAALSTFEADDVYDHADAAGFIKLFGLPVRMESRAGAVRSVEAGAA